MDWWNLSNMSPASPGYGAINQCVIFCLGGRLYAPTAHSRNACALLGILVEVRAP